MINAYDFADTTILSLTNEHKLIQEYQKTHSQKILDRILRSNIRIVSKLVSKWNTEENLKADLVQIGLLTLTRTIDKFDCVKFPHLRLYQYSIMWIKSDIKREILANHSLIRIGTKTSDRKFFFQANEEMLHKEQDPEVKTLISEMILRKKNMNNFDLVPDDGLALSERLSSNSNTEQEYSEKEELDILSGLIRELSPKEQQIIQWRFIQPNTLDLKTVALKLKCSRQYIQQLEATAIRKMKLFWENKNAEIL